MSNMIDIKEVTESIDTFIETIDNSIEAEFCKFDSLYQKPRANMLDKIYSQSKIIKEANGQIKVLLEMLNDLMKPVEIEEKE